MKVINKNLDIKITSRIKTFLKGIYRPLLRYIDKKSVETFISVITLSHTVNKQVKEIYRIDCVQTCYMGIKNIKKLAEPNDEAKTKYFLTVCRLEPIKNIQRVIEAFHLLNTQNKLKDVKYFIVGSGPFEDHLRVLVAKYNLTKQVIFCGYVESEKLLSGAYYTDCLAYIYLPFDEPFGLPYLEASAFSKPSIASNHAGPSELVIDGQTGLLADPANVKIIADKIELMANNKAERNCMSINAYKRASDNFTWGHYIDRYLDVIRSMYEEKDRVVLAQKFNIEWF